MTFGTSETPYCLGYPGNIRTGLLLSVYKAIITAYKVISIAFDRHVFRNQLSGQKSRLKMNSNTKAHKW